MRLKARAAVGIAAFALVVVACGGGDDIGGTSPPPTSRTETTSAPSTTAAVADAGQQTGVATEAPPPTAAPVDDMGNADDLASNTAVVTVGSESYVFVVDDGGSCDPDFFGSLRAFMTRVDESGTPVAHEEYDDITQGVTILVVSDEGGGASASIVAGTFGWTTDSDIDGSGVTSATLEGNRAHGTARFVDADGAGPVEGTFAVHCSAS